MAQQNGRKKAGSSGKAEVYKRDDAPVAGGRPAGKADGYSARRPGGQTPRQPRPHNSYGKVTHGQSVDKGILGSLLGLENTSSSTGSSQSASASQGTGSIFSLSGIVSLLKNNKTARIIAIILVVALIWWLVSGGQCGGASMCSMLPDAGSLGGSLGVAGSSGSESAPDLSVSNEARSRYTALKGDGSDTATVMIYMCGTDLESKYGMATADLQEMIAANISDKVNVVIETGGAKAWKNSTVSSSTNQIFEMTDGGMQLVKEVGKRSMVDPATLSDFIAFCRSEYPADRYMLIMWDHGGGSLSGYGYDQLYPNGSMTLDEINTALRDGGCQFDFIGFDACLMATLETALVVEQYADYLIASEETEPGVGWYYTNWLTALSENPSIGTVELGKKIIDDFVEVCRAKTPGDKTTLSITDLAELSATVPESFRSFATSTNALIENNDYAAISNARSSTREFASGINQVDLIDLCTRIGTSESKAFAKVLDGCVKYNRTSSNIANAGGLSIYFPYGKSNSTMSNALSTYDKIGLDDAYGDCIKSFASVSSGGQIAGAGGGDLLTSLLGTLTGGSQSSGSGSSLLSLIGLLGGGSTEGAGTGDLIGTVLSMFLGNKSSAQLTGVDVGQNEDWFSADKVMAYQDYIADNYLDPARIVITQDAEGRDVVSLTGEEWDLVQHIELNVFYIDSTSDEGDCYLDLGMDNVFRRGENGDLYMEYDNTWLTLDGRPVAYYMTSEDWSEDGESYVVTGRIPALINGERMDIIVEFTDGNPQGAIIGARTVYGEETDTVAKGLADICKGDVIDLLCDEYNWNLEYTASYVIGEQLVVGDELVLGSADIGTNLLFSYCLTDIYGNEFWTPFVEA